MLVGLRKPKNSAVFISGHGSTLQALLEMQYQFAVKVIVTNRKNILGSLKAKRFGVPILYLNSSISYKVLSEVLKTKRIDQLFLAGFMKILPPEFVESWQGRIFNIHPSLLPHYPGLGAAEKSYEDQKEMGVTIHNVTAELDLGKKFLQVRSMVADLSSAVSFPEAVTFLRRSEQHLLREFTFRRGL